MKKLGLGRKDKSGDVDDDASRSRLFGSKSSKQSKSPAASANPYATPQGAPTGDPYAPSVNSYQSSAYAPSTRAPSTISEPPSYRDGKSGYGGMQAGPGNDRGGYGGIADPRQRMEKSPVPPGGYGNSGSYANQGGYGSNRFGSGGQNSGAAEYGAPRGPGGYGGLGRTTSQDTMGTEAGRDALFGGARQRAEQRQQTQAPSDNYGDEYGSGYGGASGVEESSTGYGAYQDRQLTAEEEEEEDVQATKQQIREIKREDVSSTRNALRIAAQAEETGRATLERLGAQGERLHNTEKNLDLAASQNRLAEDKARELKKLNRSMFAVHASNPFTKSRREKEHEEEIMSQYTEDRARREATRAAAYSSRARADQASRKINDPNSVQVKKGNLAERSKYQFEADSEDEALEDEIDGNLDELSYATGRLKQLGVAMGDEIESQNRTIDRVADKADGVGDGIHLNSARLQRIK